MSTKIFNFIDDYKRSINLGLESISSKKMDSILKFLAKSFEKQKRIFLIGNGGSAALVNHFYCDFSKNNFDFNLKVFSLVSDPCLLTACANDFDYLNVFSKQLVFFAKPKDILFAVSSSGESKNIIEAIKIARKSKIKVISFTGFSGGQVKKLSHYNIHIPIHNYGVVEDCHQMIMHMIIEYFKKEKK